MEVEVEAAGDEEGRRSGDLVRSRWHSNDSIVHGSALGRIEVRTEFRVPNLGANRTLTHLVAPLELD